MADTRLSAAINTTSEQDTYHTHYAFKGRGGLRSAANAAARNAISTERREAGMEVRTLDDGKKWKLKAGPWANDNNDWDEVTEILTSSGIVELIANKGTANGYASLDSAGKVPAGQLTVTAMEYQGTWNATTNSPTLADGTGSTGDFYRVSDAGSRNLGSGSITFAVGDNVIYNGSVWQKVGTAEAVSTVYGRTGVVTAQSGDYTATQVTNTPAGSIAATTVQTALNELDTDKVALGGELLGVGSTTSAPLLKNVQKVFNVKDYGAVGDGATDDAAAINSAVTAASTTRGIVYIPRTASSYVVNSSIAPVTNTTIFSNHASVTTTNTSGNLISIVNNNNIRIEGLVLTAPAGVIHINSTGHDGLDVEDCDFLGTGHVAGNIVLASAAVANKDNTRIRYNRFVELPGSARNISLTANSHTVTNVNVYGNRFTNCRGHAVESQGSFLVKNVNVENNVDIDRVGWGPSSGRTALFNGGDAVAYQLEDLTIHNNYFKTTIIPSDPALRIGFAQVYSARNVKITNNTAYGTYALNTRSNISTHGHFFSPGRVQFPIIGLEVAHNYVQGWDGFWDPDSMVNAVIHDNICFKAGGFGTGYGIQRNVNVHDNLCLYPLRPMDGNGVLAGSTAAVSTGAPDLSNYGNRFNNNIFADDRPMDAPGHVTATAQSGGTLTADSTFYYVVTAVDEVGETVASTEVSATTTSTNKTIRIDWWNIPAATGYKVYRTTTSGSYSASSFLGSATGSTKAYRFTDTGLTPITGTPPSTSTAHIPEWTKGIHFISGNLYLDSMKGNLIYCPKKAFTTYVDQPGSVTAPKVFEDNRIIDLNDDTVVAHYYSHGNANGVTTFNAAKGDVYAVTLVGAVIPTITAGKSKGDRFTLVATQDASGGRTLSKPSNVKLVGGAFSPATGPNEVSIWDLVWDGTNWREVSRSINAS